MMKRYAVANYLTTEQKRRAIDAEYGPPHGTALCITADRCCPLEVALGLRGSTDGSSVLRAIEEALGRSDQRARVAAREFMDDVDEGRISPADLPAALGVEHLP